MNRPHRSVWYPVYFAIPELQPVIAEVVKRAGDVKLGGVLITRIPPGEKVGIDQGWHAQHYDKQHAVQLDASGEVYEFNGFLNEGKEQMTMIVFMRDE